MLKMKQAVTIIGGANGPTSIFLAGRNRRNPGILRPRQWLLQTRCRIRRSRIERRIQAHPHTIEQTVCYAAEKYGAREVESNERIYEIRKRECKSGLVQNSRPDLLASVPKQKPMTEAIRRDAKKLEQWLDRSEKRIDRMDEVIAAIPDEVFPMDFHLYKIHTEAGELELAVERIHGVFCVNWNGKDRKRLQKILRSLYLYYGVSAEDIKKRSLRYQMLLSALAS